LADSVPSWVRFGGRIVQDGPAFLGQSDQIEVGTSLLVVGFPLGFHDTLHHIQHSPG